jgi:serine protease AprX
MEFYKSQMALNTRKRFNRMETRISRILLQLAVFFLPLFCSAQSKYFIQFTDKNNSPYSVSNPSAFLTQRAIDRRNAQGISIDLTDIPVNQNYIDSVISKGANVLTRSKWFNGVTIEADVPTLQAVLALPFVIQSIQVHRDAPVTNDQERSNKFGMPLAVHENNLLRVDAFSYGQSYSQIHIMNGDYLHNAGFHGEGIVIALLDAGFENANALPAFDSLFINNQILGTWDFVAGEASVYEDYQHGMEVLSTIGGNLPGNLVGTAPKASFWLLRTEDAATEYLIEEYNWDAGAEFADSVGADIISTSLGYTVFDDATEDHTYATDMNGHTTPSARAANIAFSKGMLVIASAGNSGGSPWQYISSPADGDSVMAVAAVDTSGQYAFFSSTGPSADGDIKPNVAAVGEGTIIAYPGGSTGPGNGTSFACPVLAGSAACLWQAHPTLTNSQIKEAIQQSASQHLNPDSLLGYGIPNFMTADILLGGTQLYFFNDDKLISVFPNPFLDEVELKFYSVSNQELRIEVSDILGKKVLEKNEEVFGRINNVIHLPLSDLRKGIYVVEISSEENRFVKKIVKL